MQSARGSTSRKPTSSAFNSGLTSAAQKQESQVRYQAATAPKSTYKTPTGETKTIRADSPQVTQVRRVVTHERYVTYDHRVSSFYSPVIYAHPLYYSDHYSPFLTGWLLSSACNAADRAMWVYSHQSDMDSARYQYLLAHDAELSARVRQLEADRAVRNASYVPSGMSDNPDLMYNKDFVQAAYNPVEIPAPVAPISPFWRVVRVLFVIALVVVFVCILLAFFCVDLPESPKAED